MMAEKVCGPSFTLSAEPSADNALMLWRWVLTVVMLLSESFLMVLVQSDISVSLSLPI
jgi:hypothetical protein